VEEALHGRVVVAAGGSLMEATAPIAAG
jgi:hypothetical protein